MVNQRDGGTYETSKVIRLASDKGISPKQMFIDALKENNGDVKATAKALGLSRQRVYDYLERFNIERRYEIRIIEN